jgi:hypothetical protein
MNERRREIKAMTRETWLGRAQASDGGGLGKEDGRFCHIEAVEDLRNDKSGS